MCCGLSQAGERRVERVVMPGISLAGKTLQPSMPLFLRKEGHSTPSHAPNPEPVEGEDARAGGCTSAPGVSVLKWMMRDGSGRRPP